MADDVHIGSFTTLHYGPSRHSGCVICYFVYQTVIFLGLDADLLKMLSALVVAAILAVQNLRKRYFSKRQVKRQKS